MLSLNRVLQRVKEREDVGVTIKILHCERDKQEKMETTVAETLKLNFKVFFYVIFKASIYRTIQPTKSM